MPDHSLQSPQLGFDRRPIVAAAVVGLSMSTAAAALGIAISAITAIPWLAIILSWSIAAILVGLPALIQARDAWALARSAWHRTFGGRTLVVWVGLTVVAWSPAGASAPVRASVVMLGAISTILCLRLAAQSLGARRTGWAVAGGAALGVWTTSVLWSASYISPFIVELLGRKGPLGVAHDTMFHVALSNMLKTYGAMSTGLDGLVPVPYHIGSHWVLAQWSNLLGTDALVSYQYAYPIVIPALLTVALAALANSMSRRLFRWSTGAVGASFAGWLPLVLVLVGVLPVSVAAVLDAPTSMVLISESYVFGLVAALLLVESLLGQWTPEDNERDQSVMSRTLAWLVVVPLGAGVLAALKVSTGALGLVALVYAVWRLGYWRRPIVLLGIALAVVALAWVYSRTRNADTVHGVMLLAYLRRYLPVDAWPAFFVSTLLWVWLYTVARLYLGGCQSVRDVMSMLGRRQAIDIELLLVVAVVGLGPGLVFDVDGGAAAYFSDVQRWLACAGLMACMPPLVARWWDASAQRRAGGATPGLVGLALAPGLLVVSFSLLTNLAVPIAKVGAKTAIVQCSSGNSEAPWCRFERQWIAAHVARAGGPPLRPDSAAKKQESERLTLIAELRQMAALPREARRKMVLYVPRSLRAYWESDPRFCKGGFYLAPALGAVALLDGVPDCTAFGLDAYPVAGRGRLADSSADTGVCAAAAAKGFFRVIRIEQDAQNRIVASERDCPRRS